MRAVLLSVPVLVSTLIPLHAEVANVEADNGLVYHILEATSDGRGRAQAVIQVDGNYQQVLISFDCPTHQQQVGREMYWSYIPPRSVASGIEKIACRSHPSTNVQ